MLPTMFLPAFFALAAALSVTRKEVKPGLDYAVPHSLGHIDIINITSTFRCTSGHFCKIGGRCCGSGCCLSLDTCSNNSTCTSLPSVSVSKQWFCSLVGDIISNNENRHVIRLERPVDQIAVISANTVLQISSVTQISQALVLLPFVSSCP